MTHKQITFDLLERIEDNTDEDQEGSTSEEAREGVVDTHLDSSCRKDRDETEEDGARKGHPVKDIIEILHGLLARLYARDESAVLLHVFGHHLRIDRDSRVEVREDDDEDEEYQVIPESRIVAEGGCKSPGPVAEREEHREEHERLREDDRHNACSIDLQREILADTAILLVADNPLGVLYRNFADSLDQSDGGNDDEEPNNEFDDEDQQTAAAVGRELLGALGEEGVRKAGDDTDHNDDGDTIADSAVGDPLTQPHDEHGAGHENDRGNQVECEAAPAHCDGVARDHTGNVRRALDRENQNGKVPCNLIHLSAAALTFHLHLAERRNEHAEKLDHDGCRDVRHHTERKDRSITESTAGEHVEEADKAFLRAALESGEPVRIQTREYDVASQAVDQDQEDRVADPRAELLDLVDVLDCLDKFLHRTILFDYSCLSTGSLNLGDCGLGERVGGNLERCGQFTVAEDLDEVALGRETGTDEGFGIDSLDGEFLSEGLERRDIDSLVFDTGRVLEAELRKTALDRHLAAFETDLVGVSRAGLGTLGTTGGGTAFAGTFSATYSLAIVGCTLCRFQIFKFHLFLLLSQLLQP